MLAVRQDRLTAAVRALEPGARALLDLSLRRGVSDGDIAQLLDTDRHDVALRRSGAIEQIVAQLDLHGVSDFMRVRAALAELPPEDWGPPGAGEPEAERASQRGKRKPTARGGRTKVSLVPAAIAAGIVLIGIVIVVLLAGGGSGTGSTIGARIPAQAASEQRAAKRAAKRRAAKRTAAARNAGRPVKLARVATVSTGGGSAQLIGKGPHARLRIRLYGLPPANGGDYEAWLYNTVANALSLGSFAPRRIDLNTRLPANWEKYRYLDVSLEPADGNQNHSGQSLLRAPLARLRSP